MLQSNHSGEQPEFLTAREVADRLGARTTEHTVRRIAKQAGTYTRFTRNQIVFTESNYRDLVEYITNPPRPTEVAGTEDPFAATPRISARR